MTMSLDIDIPGMYKAMWAEVMTHSASDIFHALVISVFILLHVVIVFTMVYSIIKCSFKVMLYAGPLIVILALFYIGATSLFPNQLAKLIAFIDR